MSGPMRGFAYAVIASAPAWAAVVALIIWLT